MLTGYISYCTVWCWYSSSYSDIISSGISPHEKGNSPPYSMMLFNEYIKTKIYIPCHIWTTVDDLIFATTSNYIGTKLTLVLDRCFYASFESNTWPTSLKVIDRILSGRCPVNLIFQFESCLFFSNKSVFFCHLKLVLAYPTSTK